MTSFKSVEEVMEGDEKLFNAIEELSRKYPEFIETPELGEEVGKIHAENSNNKFLEDLKKKQWISKCEQTCRYKRHACFTYVENTWLRKSGKCVVKVVGAICRLTPGQLLKAANVSTMRIKTIKESNWNVQANIIVVRHGVNGND